MKQRNVIVLESLINWDFLTRQLAHHFDGSADPPLRLIIGLLYLQCAHNISGSDTIHYWQRLPVWQRFCGESTPDQFYLNPGKLSVWQRELGERGSNCMQQALKLSAMPSSLVH